MSEASPVIGAFINRLISGQDLSRQETELASELIVNNKVTEIQQGAFLAALTSKGPTPEEITGVCQTIYRYDTIKCSPKVKNRIIDNCGTGMDSFKSFNISTAAAIIAAAGGVCLARHGARAVTSSCGTVDVCEKLGIDVECQVSLVEKSLEQANIGLFNGMSNLVHPRALFRLLKAMRFGSILNISASLANPAAPRFSVRGVYSRKVMPTVVRTMKELGFCRALVLHGQSPNRSGGMDEISPFGTTWISELQGDGEIKNYTIEASDFGRLSIRPEAIVTCSDPEQEALRMMEILTGKKQGGRFFTVCLNTAPIFYLTGQAETLKQGFEMAAEILSSGQALSTLKDWVLWQNRDPEAGLKSFNRLLTHLDSRHPSCLART